MNTLRSPHFTSYNYGINLLASLKLPSLESLELGPLEQSYGEAPAIFVDLHERSQFQLRHLSVTSFHMELEELVEILQLLPSLETLVISNLDSDSGCLTGWYRQVRLPLLTTLILCQSSDVSDGFAVVSMIDYFWCQRRDEDAPFPSIRSIELDLNGAAFSPREEEYLARMSRQSDGFLVDRGRVAALAAAETRTCAQVQHARDLVHTSTLSNRQRLAFLAVFFPVLDPARIPRLEEEASADDKTLDNILCAGVALDAMFRLQAQGDIGLSLWPRVWPWVEFMRTHRDHLQDKINFPSERSFHFTFILFVGGFRDHPATYALMSGTPGFWACLLMAWTFLTQLDSPYECFMVLDNLGWFLANSGVRTHPERLEEMIDAAGSFIRLAGLVADFLRTFVKYYTPEIDQAPHQPILRLLTFIDEVDQFPRDCGNEATSVPIGPLGFVLYTYTDFAREIVSAVLLLCDRQEREAGRVINECLILVRRMIGTSPVTVWLIDLLESGVFRALVLITLRCHQRGWKLEHHVRYFLMLLLPASLVYFRSVVAYGNALKDVQDLLSGHAFKRTPLYAMCKWEEFLASANERVEVLAEYQSSASVVQKACDNRKCSLIKKSSCLRRCSGCQAFYYCSVECQRNDWELGHRHVCHTHDSLLLSARATLTFSERSFLRALIHDRYHKERRSICAQQIHVLSQYDPAIHIPDALFTLFELCRKSSPTIRVYPVDSSDPEAQARLHELVDTKSEEWEYIVERARLGEGCFQLHAIRVMHEGIVVDKPTRTWVVPLRTDRGELSAGLLRLSQELRQGLLAEEDLMKEIDFLLQSEDGIVEIH
ncbi:hypothetical protein FB45DRAFT_1064977 [Roridomyces roridus]|uniref:MYND-type domain-containing protein n=1 Tax=Roridomyces roridus TaxID=1738132 RepID=A0AAD7B9X0_9AGAR|nr:hypothetical protein FB45DRAFT_1064977 [Roridomyces roridus]